LQKDFGGGTSKEKATAIRGTNAVFERLEGVLERTTGELQRMTSKFPNRNPKKCVGDFLFQSKVHSEGAERRKLVVEPRHA
jgi:hypothetical protein